MLSQETRMGALGGNAEVAEPGGKMDKQVRRDLQGSFPQQFRDWVCYLAASCVFHSPGTGGREARGVERSTVLLKFQAQSHSPSWTSWRKKKKSQI